MFGHCVHHLRGRGSMPLIIAGRSYIDHFVSSSGVDKICRVESKVARELDRVDIGSVVCTVICRRRRRRRSLTGRRRTWLRGRVAAAAAGWGGLGVDVPGGRRGFDSLWRRWCGRPARRFDVLVSRRTVSRRGWLGSRARLLWRRACRLSGTTRRRSKQVVTHLWQRSEEVDHRRGWAVHGRNDAWNVGIDTTQIQVEVTAVHTGRICQTEQHSVSI